MRRSTVAVLAALTLAACARPAVHAPEPPPGGVTLGAIHHADSPLDEGSPWIVAHPDGEVEVSTFILVVSDVELHACVEARAERAGSLTETLADALVPRAHAHVPDSATRLGTPFVEDLLSADGKARVIGEIGPPLGRYCALAAVVAPADDDVLNPTELETERIEGKSVIVRGRARAEGEEEWSTFELTTAARGAYAIPLDPPLELTATDRSAFILVDKTRAASILTEIPLRELFEPRAPERLLGGLTRTFAIYPPRAATP